MHDGGVAGVSIEMYLVQVQNDLLYWYKSTNTDTRNSARLRRICSKSKLHYRRKTQLCLLAQHQRDCAKPVSKSVI